jgi:hypothetical protein
MPLLSLAFSGPSHILFQPRFLLAFKARRTFFSRILNPPCFSDPSTLPEPSYSLLPRRSERRYLTERIKLLACSLAERMNVYAN